MPSTRVKPRTKAQRPPPPPPGLLLIDGGRVILPAGRLTRGAWPEFAMTVLLEPEPSMLPAWISRIEARLGVKPEHRAAIDARAVAAVEESEAKRRRLLEQSMRASQMAAPLRDPVLVEKMAKTQAKLAAARAQVDNPPGKSDREKRRAVKQAKAKIAELTGTLRDQAREEADQRQLYGDAGDTILLAKARGENVTAFKANTAEFARDEFGARILERKRDKGRGGTYLEPVLVYGSGLRAKKLTGIDHAHDAGYLSKSWRESERLHKIGVDYRDAYIVVEGESTGGGGGGGGGGPKAPQPRQIEMGQMLADMRLGLNRRQRDVLDLVCGEDMRLREATLKLGLGDPRTAERALVTGLAAAGESLSIARARRIEEGTEGDLGRRVQFANAMLARVRA
jgi:hypothetical protein